MSGAVDLSPGAIAARRKLEEAGRSPSGQTGRELCATADAILSDAHRHRRVAAKAKTSSRENRSLRRAKEAARTAAVKVRIAELVPLDRGYLHHLTIQDVHKVEAAVEQLVHGDTDEQWAALAVDTHRRIAEQRQRARQGG